MKKLFRFILTLVVAAPLMTAAFASEAHYGQPSPVAGKKLGNSVNQVVLHNTLPQSFSVSARFVPSQKRDIRTIYPAGSPYSVITYYIVSPDTYVCVSIGGPETCAASGDLFIVPAKSANGAPSISKVK